MSIMPATTTTLDELCINTIRNLSLDAVQTANSGHPGLPLGCAVMGYVLWTKQMQYNPKNPNWFNRDRFILSAGHGCLLQYSLLYLTGYDLSLDDLKHFRKPDSKTPGHPENVYTPGVEMATGPLGQGFASSVGFAIAEKFLAATFNKPGHEIIDHYTYGICSDGDLMEGITNEAASLAGHLQLGKLIYLYDDNQVTIDGSTQLTFTEIVQARFDALGWHTQRIDGMNLAEVEVAIEAAQKVTDRPSLILCHTVIGYGSPHLEGTHKIHSNPLKPDEFKLTKDNLGMPEEASFYVPEEALAHYREAVGRGAKEEEEWNAKFEEYEKAFPKEANELRNAIDGKWGTEWIKHLPTCSEKIATRKSGSLVLQELAKYLPTLIGGSADLFESNLTKQEGYGDFQHASPGGRNINYGIREHAMVAAVNGIVQHGGTIGFGSSFLIFSDYARGALRISALMDCPSIFVFTHDSIAVGEDGPTHEPIEQLTSLRAIPNFNVIRPADGNETAAAWKIAIESEKTPTLLALTRQGVPAITSDKVQNHPLEKGAYIFKEATGDKPKLVLIGTGSELQLCIPVRETFEREGIPTRIVSMPSWYLFELQPDSYKKSVIDLTIPTVSIEAGSTLAWPRYSHAQVGVDRFGLSGPGDEVMVELGITSEHLEKVARKLLGKK